MKLHATSILIDVQKISSNPPRKEAQANLTYKHQALHIPNSQKNIHLHSLERLFVGKQILKCHRVTINARPFTAFVMLPNEQQWSPICKQDHI